MAAISGLAYAGPSPFTQSRRVEEQTQRVWEALSNRPVWGLFNGLTQEFDQIQPLQLKELLERMTERAIDQSDAITVLTQAVNALTLEQLEEAIRIKCPDFQSAFALAKSLFRTAEYYIDKTEKKDLPATVTTYLESVMHALDAVIETLITAFALSDVFKHPESEMEASFRFQKLMLLTSFVPAMTAILAPFIGVSISSALITIGAVSMLVGLSIFYGKYMRPVPYALPYGENWTDLALQGRFAHVEGCKKYVDRVAEAIILNRRFKRHPLLIGKARVGKTHIIKAFAHAVARGDYPALKGKKIFYFNTANLVKAENQSWSDSRILKCISDIMGKHRENVILVFDELQNACLSEFTNFSESLKTRLDEGNENFPYAIGITTTNEFYNVIYKSNSAFAHRFREIVIDNSDLNDTVEVLNSYLLKEAPQIPAEEGVIKYIVEETTKQFSALPQPFVSLDILAQCIQKATESLIPQMQNKVEHKENDIRDTCSIQAVANKIDSNETSIAMEKMEGELTDLQTQLKEETQKLEKLIQVRNKLGDVKTLLYQTVLRVNHAQGASVFQNKDTDPKLLLLLAHILMPSLEGVTRNMSGTLKVDAIISRSLVDRIIAQELARRKKIVELASN